MYRITVRVYRCSYDGKQGHIETHDIYDSGLSWWKSHSGRGDFDLISYTKLF